MVGLGDRRGDGLEREAGAVRVRGPQTGAGILSAAGAIAGFEAPVMTGSDSLRAKDTWRLEEAERTWEEQLRGPCRERHQR